MTSDWVTEVARLKKNGIRLVVVTVIRTVGSVPREVGSKMIVTAEGRTFGTIGGGRLEELAILDAQKCLHSGNSEAIRYPLGAKTAQCCGGVVELLLEVLGQNPSLYCFGAGHVGQALVKALAGTAFSVHLIDERPEWLNHPDLAEQSVRRNASWEDFVDAAPWSETDTYVTILTHRHAIDEMILEAVLRRPRRYVGLIGSRAKWERFRSRLQQKGFSAEDLARVRCPMGLVLGGKSPAEIAISVAAEMLHRHYQAEIPVAKTRSESTRSGLPTPECESEAVSPDA